MALSSAELLLAAAEALDDHTDPFCDKFLSDNEVTFDQVMALSQQLAIGARIMARGIKDPKSPQGMAMFQQLFEDAK